MSHRAVVWALTVVLIASALLAVVPAAARAASLGHSPARAGPHPSAFLAFETWEGGYAGAYPSVNFYPGGGGDGQNILYFSFTDTFLGDHFVNVTLTDPNASRDGVGSPAWHVEVAPNNVTGSYASYQTGVHYTFPSNIVYGGGWNITASAPLAGNQTIALFLHTFYVNINSNIPGQYVVPTESFTLGWQIYSESNGAPYSAISSVSIDALFWTQNGSYWNVFSPGIMTLPATSFGSTTFTIPKNATPSNLLGARTLEIGVWANTMSGGHVAENESSFGDWGIGNASVRVLGLTSVGSGGGTATCPTGGTQYYGQGDTVEVCAQVGAVGFKGSGFTPVPNLPVSIAFWNSTNVVTPGGSPPSQLTSNASGEVAFSFTATSPPFSYLYGSPSYYNDINLTVKVPGATSPVGMWTAWDNQTFYIDYIAATGVISVATSQLEYFPGQAVTATWTVSSSSASVGTVTAVDWTAWSYRTGAYLGGATISSTATTGTFTVTLPTGFQGEFELEVQAVNATTSFWGYAYAYVMVPRLFLNPSTPYYTPGQQVSVAAEIFGGGSIAGATISYEVWGYYEDNLGGGQTDGLVMTGTVANNSAFSWIVPASGGPTYYEVSAWVSAPGAGTVATASVEIDSENGYQVLVGVTTPSSYADGSYQPGQTVTFSYTLSTLNGRAFPTVYTYEIFLFYASVGGIRQGTGTTGSFSIKIPSNMPGGSVFVEMDVFGTLLRGPDCGSGDCFGETAVTVNPSPSFLSMEVPAGSGVTIGWIILLVVIIVVAVILVLMIRRKRMPPTSSGASVTTPMSPAAPAPSTDSPNEWKEPAPPGGGDSPPPMPNPPAGGS